MTVERREGHDLVEEIRSASDIVGIVGGYVRLKKAGRSFKGLCPFHKEKTPSFIVTPERQTFHCFGCGKGGDVFTFLMEMDGIGFPEALRTLAGRAGIRIPERGNPKLREKRERQYALLQFAGRFYRSALGTGRGAKAQSFLKARGINGESAEKFGIGFAPDEWRSLRERALTEGFADQELVETGLAVPREGSPPYDRFRGRVLFPIRNVGGRVIGFGGRVLGEGEPKYLNSPETELFRKGDALYGLSETKGEIRREGTALVVEGYTDLISLYQGGVTNVVAPLGTAFTPNQARMISHYAERAVLLFDGDEAGRKAALRSIETLAGESVRAEVAVLPDGSDPDQFLRDEGEEALRRLIDGSVGIVPFILDNAYAGSKERGIRAAVRVMASVRDDIRLSLLIRETREKTGITEEVLLREVLRRRKEDAHSETSEAVRLTPVPRKRMLDAERGIAYLGVEYPDLLPVIRKTVDPERVEDIPARKLLKALYDADDRGEPPGRSIFSLAGVDGDFSRIRVEAEEEGEEDPLPRLQDYIACVREEGINRRMSRIQDELKDAEDRNDTDACARLLKERTGLARQKSQIVAALRGESGEAPV